MIMSYVIMLIALTAAFNYGLQLVRFGQGKEIDSSTIMFSLIFTTILFIRIFYVELEYVLYWKP